MKTKLAMLFLSAVAVIFVHIASGLKASGSSMGARSGMSTGSWVQNSIPIVLHEKSMPKATAKQLSSVRHKPSGKREIRLTV